MVDLKKDEQAAFDAVNKTESWVKTHWVWATVLAIVALMVLGFIVGHLWH